MASILGVTMTADWVVYPKIEVVVFLYECRLLNGRKQSIEIANKVTKIQPWNKSI